MSEVTIEQAAQLIGQNVTIKGWLYNRRSSKKLHFLQIRDGSGYIQAVMFKPEVGDEVFEAAGRIPFESSVILSGEAKADERSPLGYEIGVSELRVVNEARDEYPISKKEHGVDFLMEHRHLWLRSKRQHAILRVRAELVAAIRDYFDSNGFLLVDAPIFTPAACEGTTTLFQTDYFGDKAYLTQSGQLYMEAAAMAHGKVYCFGPTFRAEKSKTRRHLTEFWMVEPEVAFLDLDGDMDLAEDFLCYIVQRVVSKREPELRLLERDLSKLELVRKPFPRISYDQAVALIREQGLEFEDEDDFGAEHETAISKNYDRPVMIHRYPSAVKAFYMKRDPQRPQRALCVDVIAPEGVGEIIGGGQREDELDLLQQRIDEHGLPREAFQWYLDLRRYGGVPHAGFGLGVERTVGWLCGVPHVREVIPFPRLMTRIYP
ncbi:MAG: asparagine--tRNA ligase [Candidatus Alcyoniella australis]|nr:asparagine--tRNA ligase [Candidatus Alcyoniella australis]